MAHDAVEQLVINEDQAKHRKANLKVAGKQERKGRKQKGLIDRDLLRERQSLKEQDREHSVASKEQDRQNRLAADAQDREAKAATKITAGRARAAEADQRQWLSNTKNRRMGGSEYGMDRATRSGPGRSLTAPIQSVANAAPSGQTQYGNPVVIGSFVIAGLVVVYRLVAYPSATNGFLTTLSNWTHYLLTSNSNLFTEVKKA